MRPVMDLAPQPLALLDEEAWEAPHHLTEDEAHVVAGPDWRRSRAAPETLETCE